MSSDIIKQKTLDKPIIKWIGGKTQILNELIVEFPKNINNYHEFFLGGGSVLFRLLNEVKDGNIKINGNINAYDINEPLINVYINIKTNHMELYTELLKVINIYNNISIDNGNKKPTTDIESISSKESYYYWIRHKYNELSNNDKNTIIGTSYFIFLNKTGFRGVFRLNSKGKYNVPYGNYKNPEIINLEHLNYINELIQNVNFECKNYNESFKTVVSDDFVYMDPPYAPENSTSFVSYTENGFNIDEHNRLFTACNNLNDNNIKFIMSNADVKLVRDNFENVNYKIKSILCKRSINSKKPDSKTKELIIKNY